MEFLCSVERKVEILAPVSTVPGNAHNKLLFSSIKVAIHFAPGIFTYVFHLLRASMSQSCTLWVEDVGFIEVQDSLRSHHPKEEHVFILPEVQSLLLSFQHPELEKMVAQVCTAQLYRTSCFFMALDSSQTPILLPSHWLLSNY
jgi:hypothetical protein